MTEIPDKLFYKPSEVCRYTDVQPYVLRFWESEFPQIARQKDRAGQRVYSREDLELIVRIKALLNEQEYTIAGVRDLLEREARGGATLAGRPLPVELRRDVEEAEQALAEPGHVDSYKASYDAAREEIETLRKRLAEAEEKYQKTELALAESERARSFQRERSERVATRLEELVTSLEARPKKTPKQA